MTSSAEILLTIKLQNALFIDPKRIRLLKEIEACGSINQAAKNAQVSYKSAWDHLEAMNNISPKPLLERNIGGKNGGGTSLTPYAKRLLQLYDLLEKTQAHAFEILQDESIPLDSLLAATNKFSLQSSARNQFVGKVSKLALKANYCLVEVSIAELHHPLQVSITSRSAERLGLSLGKEVVAMFKAPWLNIQDKAEEDTSNQFPATIISISPEEILLKPKSSDTILCASLKSGSSWQAGQAVWVSVAPEQIILATLVA